MIPTAEDGALIRRHQSFFKQHTNEILTGFYDVVLSDTATREYISESERAMRENTLRGWYEVSILGQFDEHYWKWQVLVGIVHVKHNIPNAAMLGMWGWMVNFLQQRLLAELPVEEALAVLQVLQKLQTTVCALVVESFILTQQEAIRQASGLRPTIMERFIQIEINSLLKQGRAHLACAEDVAA
ncbi:protoglobin domain-containing protein [Candidatus Thiothrix sp. Deng01]|uniref:Protoglobin domain-containing protein n=1 Tax=Candidatus Thiothrix phosphatis TaxID=3112415 RepID=A0ABU6CXV3_9GAMM|nr:protoglobin domain-containing protein [Candidatus Thiothrix sp. Deng01]MEB4590928.1 protoglobin domain-containing protein [Candidatus Thiothrix sp. Deng01]